MPLTLSRFLIGSLLLSLACGGEETPTGPGDWLAPLTGLVFLQAGGVGLASYHFDGTDDIYISYSNAPLSWVLGNGTPPPPKKLFVGTAFDPTTRTFTGTVDWSDPEQTTFGTLAERWVYEMVFDENYTAITGGHVGLYNAAGGLLGIAHFGIELFYTVHDAP